MLRVQRRCLNPEARAIISVHPHVRRRVIVCLLVRLLRGRPGPRLNYIVYAVGAPEADQAKKNTG